MRLNKPIKLIVGALTAWPLVYMFVFLGFIVVSIARMGRTGDPARGMPTTALVFFVVHFATILLMFGLLTFYAVYLYNSERVPKDKKALWAAVLFLGNVVAMPVFFYVYVWPDEWPNQQLGLRGDSSSDAGAT